MIWEGEEDFDLQMISKEWGKEIHAIQVINMPPKKPQAEIMDISQVLIYTLASNDGMLKTQASHSFYFFRWPGENREISVEHQSFKKVPWLKWTQKPPSGK